MVRRAGFGSLPLFLSPARSLSFCVRDWTKGPDSSCSDSYHCPDQCFLWPLMLLLLCRTTDRDANHYRITYSAPRGCRIMMLLWQDLTLPCRSLSARTLARSDLRNYMEIVFVFSCQYISRRWGSNSLWFVWKEALAGKSHLSIVSRALSPRPQSTQWLWNYRETGSWIQKIGSMFAFRYGLKW